MKKGVLVLPGCACAYPGYVDRAPSICSLNNSRRRWRNNGGDLFLLAFLYTMKNHCAANSKVSGANFAALGDTRKFSE